MSSSPYARFVSSTSQNFQGYVNAPVTGPLNSSQYPLAMPYHSYGSLPGVRPTPPQFYPSQEPVMSDLNTNARAYYLRAASLSMVQKMEQNALGKLSEPLIKTSYSSQRQFPVSSHMNYIAPVPSSMRTNLLKAQNVGKSAYKVGLPDEALLSTKSYDVSLKRSALRRARSAGSVAPKKKGSIYNYNLTQPGINGWGSIPRQNY